MSDPVTPTTTPPAGTPNAQAGQPGGQQPTPAGTQAPAPTTPATPAPSSGPPVTGGATAAAVQPYRAFADQKELDDFVKGAKTQAERSAIRKMAKDLGFEDADEMREALGTLRQAQGAGAGAQPNTPETPAAASNQPNRLEMALAVGTELNLPIALVNRLQGNTPEEMKADANILLGLMSNGQARPPGIPPVPAGTTPVTFTATQLKDPAFVREHTAAIQQAAREGRIVRS